MVKIRKDGQPWLYSINEESPLVKHRDAFDNSLIESMVGWGEIQKDPDEPWETCPDDPVKNIRIRIRKGSVLS